MDSKQDTSLKSQSAHIKLIVHCKKRFIVIPNMPKVFPNDFFFRTNSLNILKRSSISLICSDIKSAL